MTDHKKRQLIPIMHLALDSKFSSSDINNLNDKIIEANRQKETDSPEYIKGWNDALELVGRILEKVL